MISYILYLYPSIIDYSLSIAIKCIFTFLNTPYKKQVSTNKDSDTTTIWFSELIVCFNIFSNFKFYILKLVIMI